MATLIPNLPAFDWAQGTIADLHARLGGIPLERIRLHPPPGKATEEDVLEAEARWGRVCELVDGVLVEKAMASYESILAGVVIYLLRRYLQTQNLGTVLGEAGLLRISAGQVRAPDVSFIRWQRFPGGELPGSKIYTVAPDLAVEILSPSNTQAEIDRKLREYFTAGTQLVWVIEPQLRKARAYTAADRSTEVSEDGFLFGADVLPTFELSLRELFSMAGSPKTQA